MFGSMLCTCVRKWWFSTASLNLFLHHNLVTVKEKGLTIIIITTTLERRRALVLEEKKNFFF